MAKDPRGSTPCAPTPSERRPIDGFNLGGYQHGAYATGSANRHEFGGLTDASFRMIPLLEAGKTARWPWQ
jgi:hypothetical protein